MSHKTLDQFDLEPTVCYSGTYTSDILSGSIESGRYIVGQYNITSSLLTVVKELGQQIDYNDYARELTSISFLGSNRILTLGCPEELIYDSLTPSIVELHLSSSNYWATPITEKSAPWSFGTPGCIQLGFPDVFMTSSIGNNITNTKWSFSYPFQGSFRSLNRKIELPGLMSFPNVNLIKTGSELVAVEGSSSIMTNPNEFCVMFLYLSSSNGKIPLYPTSQYAVGANIALNIKGTIGNNANFQDAAYTANNRNIIQLLFFGMGDGFRNQPLFRRQLVDVSGAFDAVTQVSLHKCQGVEIRGFRYGLANALPVYNGAIWRRDRFGQFRDMLEQRKFTKFLNPQDGSGLKEAAIKIIFVSGSSAATESNPTDSGIFDHEAKSGQPWYDFSKTI